jgi:hypothetical protein
MLLKLGRAEGFEIKEISKLEFLKIYLQLASWVHSADSEEQEASAAVAVHSAVLAAAP